MAIQLDLVEKLKLEPHVEGGYFIRTYESPRKVTTKTKDGSDVERAMMSSIYYLLTKENPINHFHKNLSDIVHYFHLGLPIKYHIISPEGDCSTVVMGPDIMAGLSLVRAFEFQGGLPT